MERRTSQREASGLLSFGCTHSLPSGWTAGTTTSTYNDRDQLLSTVAGAATMKFGYDANGSLTTRKNGSNALLFRQGYDLKNRLVEADAGGDADADLRLAYDHQEGRVARHTLDGTGAVTASEHYLLDRMNPTGYEQVLEQAAGLDASHRLAGQGRERVRDLCTRRMR